MVQVSFTTSIITLFLLASNVFTLPLTDIYKRDVASLDERALFDLYERDLSCEWLNDRDEFELESRAWFGAKVGQTLRGAAKEFA
jgi:hypothetical protein